MAVLRAAENVAHRRGRTYARSAALDVGHTSIQTQAFEREEAMVAVKRRCPVVDGIDHHRTRPVLTRSRDSADQRVAQQIRAEPGALFGGVEREPCEEENGNGIRLATPETGRRAVSPHAPHGERVVADNDGVTTEHPRGRRSCRRRDGRVAAEPVVEVRLATLEPTRDVLARGRTARPVGVAVGSTSRNTTVALEQAHQLGDHFGRLVERGHEVPKRGIGQSHIVRAGQHLVRTLDCGRHHEARDALTGERGRVRAARALARRSGGSSAAR